MAKKVKDLTQDGWKNILTGLGDPLRDKREYTGLALRVLSFDALALLYRMSDLAARIVDLPAEEMCREGFDVRIEDDEESAELIGAALDDLKATEKVLQVVKYARLFGGGALLLGVNDGVTDLSEPLDEEKVYSLDFLTVFDSFECQPIDWHANPYAKDFGEPLFYRIQPHHGGAIASLQKVHASRVIALSGPLASRKQARGNSNGSSAGWGDSVLFKCAELIRDYDSSWAGISHLLADFAQTVYKLKGLAQALMADKDNLVKNRMLTIDMSRSLIKAVLLDADGEDFERKSTAIGGVPEVMDKFATRLAAAANMPATVLFGQSPAGLNATGASDIRFFYDSIRAQQKRDLLPILNRLAKLIMVSKAGPLKGQEPEEWNVVFRTLWQTTDTEKAEVRLKMAQVDRAYLDMGVLSTADIAESRFGGDEYSIETQMDPDALEERDAVAAEQAALGMEGQKLANAAVAVTVDPKADPKPEEK